MTCQDCGSQIEEGRKDRAPIAAKYCLACRSKRRHRKKLKYFWLPQHDAYMRAHYHGGLRQRERVINELVRQTGFPLWHIKRQAQRLGLTMHSRGPQGGALLPFWHTEGARVFLANAAWV